MYLDNTIKWLHLELTNRCNAGCPACPRSGTFPGHVSETIWNSGIHDLTLDDIKLLHSQLPDLIRVNLCGNYGDPAVSSHFKEIVQYFRANNVRVIVSTNGAPRTPDYWADLAIDDDVRISWHIDGDEDTNHMYRVGTKFEKIMANAEAFIKAGGNARWVFIPFAHNEHVIDKCKAMSKEMGFRSFDIKKSYRVHNKNERSEVKIDLPKNEKYINGVANNRKDKNVDCKSVHDKELYIACNGEIFPCCWWGSYFWDQKYKSEKDKRDFQFLMNFENNYKTGNQRPVMEIVQDFRDRSDIYQLVWDMKRFHVCNKHCGTQKWEDRYVKDEA